MSVGRCLLVVVLAQVCAGELQKPYHDCPRYVAEGATLSCTCSVADTGSQVTSLLWVGMSSTSRLTVANVTRRNNGTVYTCRLTQGGQTSETSYTLQVAYGPFDNLTSIVQSPSPLLTNGSMSLNFTCICTEVNPEPLYSWTVTCVNPVQGSNVCVYVPKVPNEDGIRVGCSVMSQFFDGLTLPKTAYSLTNMSLQYPPAIAPNISVSTGQSLATGDNLTCTVTGGKPVVSRVTFSCYNLSVTVQSDIIITDSVDVVQQSSVSSPLTVPSSGSSSVRCICTAEWTPQPDLYRLSTSVDLQLLYPPTTAPVIAGYTQGQAMVYGDTLSCTVYGGKPIVSRVTFSCFNSADLSHTNDVISDQNDTVGASSVSSPLSIPRAVTFNITCTCRAVWMPRPELYAQSSSVTIPIQYPPSAEPVISGYTPSQALAPQSTLVCTVSGGQPLVSEVIFSCFNVTDLTRSTPILVDQTDSTNASSVSSSLTVPLLLLSQIVCSCRAVWLPRRDMYTQNTTATVALQYPPSTSPVISGYTPGETKIAGDNLNCTVSGGVPLVTKVNFSCFNASDTSLVTPVVVDQLDTVSGSAVSSQVTIPGSGTSSVSCVCSAVWSPVLQAYTATANVTVPVQYPPSQDPVISGYTDGQTLKPGDSISCSVAGGNPLVSQVIFSCYNLSDVTYVSPVVTDQQDNKTLTAVTSSVTVPFAGLTDVRCVCSATWSPRPSLYTRNTGVSIALQYPPYAAPVISGYRAGREVVTGDSLVCTVSGGKPLVSNVTLTCSSVTTPSVVLISDGPDTTGVTNVTSSVTIPASVTSDVTCVCTAVWAPQPGYYLLLDSVNLTVKYPPSQDPVIAGYTPGQTLTSGDRLNCSVAGGNPLVSQVIFSCPNILPDQPDTSQSAAVFSSLTIPSTAMTDAVCTCRAEWSPKPQLYTRNTSIVISTNYPPSMPPAITGYGAGYTVVTGDNLTCSVNGGRPLVSRVFFSCFSVSDVINDQPDVTLSTSVTSSVTIPTQNTNVLTCACRADWSPRLEAYPWNTTVNIQVLYPPSSSPVISGYTEGQPMNTGGTLSCAVTGGSPLVSSVIFQCVDSTNPGRVVFSDQADTVVQPTVYSQLTVSDTTVYAVTCSCRAVWTPKEALYSLTKSAQVILQNPPSSAPVISGYTPGQQIVVGSILTCTVTGGNPLVSQVVFTCYSPANIAVMADEPDTFGQTSVSSRVTFPETDFFNVTCVCSAVWSPRPETYSLTSSINIQLQYIPPYPPQISGYRQGDELSPGNTLLCSVIGGNPLVSAVTFSCFNSNDTAQSVTIIPDQHDTVTNSSVSSPLTIIDTSSSSLRCTCSATWSPRPLWYLTTAIITFNVRSKAKILSFTINNVSGNVTLNETDKRTATLSCLVQGRPQPTITLYKTGYASISSISTTGSAGSADITNVQCENMGDYSCRAENGFPEIAQQTVKLIVNCAPRRADSYSSVIQTLTSSGLTFNLLSNPKPDTFSYAYLGSSGSDKATTGSYSALFNASCSKATVLDPLVTCQVNATGQPVTTGGVYSLHVANAYGSFEFLFRAEQQAAITEDSNNRSDTLAAAIAGGVVAAVVLIFVIVILTVFFCMGRKHKKMHISSRSRLTDDSRRNEAFLNRHHYPDGFYDFTNSVYIADGGMVETRPPNDSLYSRGSHPAHGSVSSKRSAPANGSVSSKRGLLVNGSVSSKRSLPANGSVSSKQSLPANGSVSSKKTTPTMSSEFFEYKDIAGFRKSESKALQESGYSTLSGASGQERASSSRPPSIADDSDKRSIASTTNGKVRFILPSEKESSEEPLYASVNKKPNAGPTSQNAVTSGTSTSKTEPVTSSNNGGKGSAGQNNSANSFTSNRDSAKRQRLHGSIIKVDQPAVKKSNLKQSGNPR
ncbi:mucin-5AC-like isoform X2 [Pomacea canaliculata]|uniref:mucin-5AC-like isoform X2 n=1 Tax=Pomacea canaliculata TaxID=400727 RepID=UPI000D72EE3B|nr:mucin-5AC-like isoform X2 [Pomacea canaliculata]